jgi:hydrogenase maturation protein HypF
MTLDADVIAVTARHALRVRGAVQGVGFRPFVHRLARELGLTGWVRNDGDGVAIEVQGDAADVVRFERRIEADAPPLARIDSMTAATCPSVDEDGFSILASRPGRITTSVPADAGPCRACLEEMCDPADRRHRYAFINCTHCGPRFTITRALPYDRAQTSMAAFEQCPACLREYRDPLDRRFHAEPNACPACGPALDLVDARGCPIGGDPVAATVALLQAGGIVAIKGLGGFHLACDARDAAAVARLRARKHRDEKPFAVMAANAASATRWVHADGAALALLASPARPIVLLPMQPGVSAALVGVAPGLETLGMMLPATPLQVLLFHEAAGRPAGTGVLDRVQDLLLVMTSANPGGEPVVIDNAEARERLGAIADACLTHDRDIVVRCDDSVVRARTDGAPLFVRRSRGHTPAPIRLPAPGPSVLATGAWLKNAVCVTRGDEAFLSAHVGDLDTAAGCRALVEAAEHLCRILDVRPELVAHDLHPEFFSTRYALDRAAERSLPAYAIQHHHAHIAAVAAEHGVTGPVLGLALDGVGLGSDGEAWGGELLRVDGGRFERLGHLAPLALPGGDVAAREPWRMAAAALHRLGRSGEIVARFGTRHPAAPAVATMLARDLRCPATTSLGRCFDAAAALLGVRESNAFEGQAPMLLEALASTAQHAGRIHPAGPLAVVRADGTLDLLPLLARMADACDPTQAAFDFHVALADGLARWVRQAAASSGLRTVALGGGCFLNVLLTSLLRPRLIGAGLVVLEARQAPPNDGGIALGQAWAAICRHAEER